MSKTKQKIKTIRLKDKEVLFFAKAAEIGMTEEEKKNPMCYVNKINYLAFNRITTVDQVVSLLPQFIVKIEEEDAKQIYKNMRMV